MSEFIAFFQLGFGHIVTAGALDHILFLVALAVVYRASDWRDALWVISAFTVGHSVTLALAVTNTVSVPEPIVEFLIPLTIVATAAENLTVRERRYRPFLAGVFGLVHGAGFAGYLKSLFVERIATPLLGFNVGIEVGQILVLAVIGAALIGVDAVLLRVQIPRLASLARDDNRRHRERSRGICTPAVILSAPRLSSNRQPVAAPHAGMALLSDAAPPATRLRAALSRPRRDGLRRHRHHRRGRCRALDQSRGGGPLRL